ncbi:fatty acid-binding protein-like [Plodia interpunctella]|uniref:fatty acid-binding protein-like n=1 Tax=Plodia interpunctella TaxID=58824 RepID=UPI002368F2F7|nr:uncharacterized protein LOC128673784 [Plodia interpunctella]
MITLQNIISPRGILEQKMSFSGKKFRRVRCENVEELVKAANINEHISRILQCSAPTFCFTKLDDETFQFTLQTEEIQYTKNFRLGEELEMERRDGCKVKITYTMEGDNVLKQMIKQPDGKVAYFRREFGDTETKMIITTEGTNIQAFIYYEVVE